MTANPSRKKTMKLCPAPTAGRSPGASPAARPNRGAVLAPTGASRRCSTILVERVWPITMSTVEQAVTSLLHAPIGQ